VRWLMALIGGAVVAASFPAVGATVTLDDGRQLQGRVIVRSDVLTLLAEVDGRQRLYQFPMCNVIRVAGEDPESPTIVSRRTALRASDSRRSEPLLELERGLEVKRIAVRGGWVQVEAWNEETRGFILDSELASQIQLSPEERATIRARLGVVDPPPPPGSSMPARREDTSPSEAKPAETESLMDSMIEDASPGARPSDASITQ